MKFLLGFVVALVLVAGGGLLYLKFGNLPVAATDPAFPMEEDIVKVPLKARVAREMQQPPFPIHDRAKVPV